MMRRRRNETNARSRVPYFSNLRVDLVPRQLPTFAGLGTLCNFDLQFLSVDQEVTGYTKTSGPYLLNRAVARDAVRFEGIASWIFATLPGVTLAAVAIHRNAR